MARKEMSRKEEMMAHLVAAWYWMNRASQMSNAYKHADVRFRTANRIAEELRAEGELGDEEFTEMYKEAARIARQSFK